MVVTPKRVVPASVLAHGKTKLADPGLGGLVILFGVLPPVGFIAAISNLFKGRKTSARQALLASIADTVVYTAWLAAIS